MKPERNLIVSISFAVAFSLVKAFSTTISRTSSLRSFISTKDAPMYERYHRGGVLQSTPDQNSQEKTSEPPSNNGIDVSTNPALYSLRISRAMGIDWGTDLSFSFVYVRAIEPGGAADYSGVISVGDQICQIQSVLQTEDGGEVIGEPINLVGAPFDAVMGSFAALGKTVKELDLVFFKGTKEELIAAAKGDSGDSSEADPEDDFITITVIEKGEGNSAPSTIKKIRAKKGCNVRQTLTDVGINVYQSFTRWTNCKGKQLCGTCIVNMTEGGVNTNRKSMDEASTLRENPETYRLSCVTFAYGDVTVETFPPVGKAQWTR